MFVAQHGRRTSSRRSIVRSIDPTVGTLSREANVIKGKFSFLPPFLRSGSSRLYESPSLKRTEREKKRERERERGRERERERVTASKWRTRQHSLGKHPAIKRFNEYVECPVSSFSFFLSLSLSLSRLPSLRSSDH